MDGIIEGLPDRPLTQEEVTQIEEQDAVIHLESILGVTLSDLGDRFHVQAGFHPQPGWHFEFYLDLIIETDSSIGIAAYPKEEYPPYGEGLDQSLLETISVPDGTWSWISKGRKPDYDIEDGLRQLEEYRDFTPDQQETYETLVEDSGIQILTRKTTD